MDVKSPPFSLDAAVLDMLGRGVALMVGSASAELQPELCRGWGPTWDAGAAELSVLLPLPAAKRTVANLEVAPAIAINFTRPTDYSAFQLKGRKLAQRTPSAEDWRVARAHFDAFLAEMPQVGLDPATYSAWFPAEGLTVVARVERAFQQAPGPSAGTPL